MSTVTSSNQKYCCPVVTSNLILQCCHGLKMYSRPNRLSDGSIDGGLFKLGLCAECLCEQTRHSSGWLTFDEWYKFH